MPKSFKTKKTKHFREEIRQSFILYALIPTIVVSLFIMVGFFAIWGANINSLTRRDNVAVASSLEKVILNYANKVEELSATLSINDISSDKNAISKAYSSLKSFISDQDIGANFIVLDKSFATLVQGSAEAGFVVPQYQNEIIWGALGRMKADASRLVVELSREYSALKISEIIVGRAIVENGVLSGYIVFSISEKDVLENAKSISTPFVITNSFGQCFLSTSRYYINSFGKIDNHYRYSDNAFYLTEKEAIYKSNILSGLFEVYTILNIEQVKFSFFISIVMLTVLLIFLSLGMIKSAKKIAEEKSEIIDKIVTAYQKVEMGNLNDRLSIDANEEFLTIAAAYNKMLDDIKGLIAANNREIKEKYLSEIKQLEMQFNPHFLFNTLENVKYMIKLNPDAAEDVIVNLSEILRYSINNEISEVFLSDDVKYISSYLQILKTRFNKRFDFSIDISPLAKYAVIPKLIIQPIIENSVKYGFGTKDSLEIKISANIVRDNLEIVITDSGDGIEPDALAEIQKLLSQETNSTNHIGLFNVQRRIKLLYGDAYSVIVKSKIGFGTTTKLIIPNKKQMKIIGEINARGE